MPVSVLWGPRFVTVTACDVVPPATTERIGWSGLAPTTGCGALIATGALIRVVEPGSCPGGSWVSVTSNVCGPSDTGDTGVCDNVVRLASGADILVHEVIDVERLTRRMPDVPSSAAIRNHLASAHSSPEQVGEIATRAGVGVVVLSHLVPGDGDPSDEEWEARVQLARGLLRADRRPHRGEHRAGVEPLLDHHEVDARLRVARR